MSPIVGIAVKVHHGKHKDAIGLYAINDRERKPVKSVLPNPVDENAESLRCKSDSCNRGLKFIEKLTPKADALFVIPFGGGNYLRVGIRMNDNPVHRQRSRARRNVSSAEMH